MRVAYRASGGTARHDAVARLLEQRRRGDAPGLSGLIASGAVCGFAWRDSVWVPLFQFDPVDMSIRSGSRRVLDADLPAVLRAAYRADHRVAAG